VRTVAVIAAVRVALTRTLAASGVSDPGGCAGPGDREVARPSRGTDSGARGEAARGCRPPQVP